MDARANPFGRGSRRTVSAWSVVELVSGDRFLIGRDDGSGVPLPPILIRDFDATRQAFSSSDGESYEVSDFGLATLPVRLAWRDWCRKHHITAYSERTEHYETAIACYRATLRRVLFLDFDGVLHPDPLQPIPGRFLRGKPVVRYVPVEQPFVHVDLLERLLRMAPDVGLVVHSAWRHSKSHLQLRDCLGPLRHRFLEGTHGQARWRSIQAWLQDYQSVTDFLVLDNSPSEFPMPAPRQLVVCPSDTGISSPTVMARLRAWLAQS